MAEKPSREASLEWEDYDRLAAAALNGGEAEAAALAEWFDKFGLCWWDGISYEIDGQHRLTVKKENGSIKSARIERA